jgi:hypothetical protein
MSIIRLIHIKIDPSETEKAIQVWKTECAPLMIQQKGSYRPFGDDPSRKILRGAAPRARKPFPQPSRLRWCRSGEPPRLARASGSTNPWSECVTPQLLLK